LRDAGIRRCQAGASEGPTSLGARFRWRLQARAPCAFALPLTRK
jgi:hypothetical protein